MVKPISSNLPTSYSRSLVPRIEPSSDDLLGPVEGKSCCAPGTIASLLIYRSTTKFPGLVPGVKGKAKELDSSAIKDLLRKLKELLKLEEEEYDGATDEQIILGLLEYAREKGYKIKLKFAGEDINDSICSISNCQIATEVPTPDFIMQHTGKDWDTIVTFNGISLNALGEYETEDSGHCVAISGHRRNWNEFTIIDPQEGRKTPHSHYTAETFPSLGGEAFYAAGEARIPLDTDGYYFLRDASPNFPLSPEDPKLISSAIAFNLSR